MLTIRRSIARCLNQLANLLLNVRVCVFPKDKKVGLDKEVCPGWCIEFYHVEDYGFKVLVWTYPLAGWQKQGLTWHIVPRNYSTKVKLIDLIIEKKWGKEEKSRRKMEKS